MKIKCTTLGPSVRANHYTTPKGTRYLFFSGKYTEIADEEDAKWLLAQKNFAVEGSEPEPVEVHVHEIPKQTYDELKALNKNQQIRIIKELDPRAMIPQHEEGRIKLIMELQDRR